jgi:hypothetical protein
MKADHIGQIEGGGAAEVMALSIFGDILRMTGAVA